MICVGSSGSTPRLGSEFWALSALSLLGIMSTIWRLVGVGDDRITPERVALFCGSETGCPFASDCQMSENATPGSAASSVGEPDAPSSDCCPASLNQDAKDVSTQSSSPTFDGGSM